MVSDEVLEFLMGYDFPGNVRELENIIEHASVLCRRDVITMEHLPRELTGTPYIPKPAGELKNHIMDSEKDLIRTMLAGHNGDRAKRPVPSTSQDKSLEKNEEIRFAVTPAARMRFPCL